LATTDDSFFKQVKGFRLTPGQPARFDQLFSERSILLDKLSRGADLKTQQRAKVQRGFSLIELLVVVAIVMLIAAFAVPNIMQAVYTARLRSTAGELAGLLQQARITATKTNQIYDIKYITTNGVSDAYLDLNLNGALDAGEPVVFFNSGVTPASTRHSRRTPCPTMPVAPNRMTFIGFAWPIYQ
jgi:prepilin-type N-terminal cleavage/methylation domain-containing protein